MDHLLTKAKTNNSILNQENRLGQENKVKKIVKTENEILKM